MKKFGNKKIGLAFLVCGIVGLSTVFAIGQARGGFGHGFFFDKIAKEIGLSDEQKTQAKQVLEDAKTRIEPLQEAMKAGHESAKDLGKDGTFDEKAVNALATQQTETMKQIIIEKEKTKAALFAILTPEQRTKANELQVNFESKMKDKFGKDGEGFGKRGHRGEGFPPMF
jgi:periplasmic protein CpxP/Spy